MKYLFVFYFHSRGGRFQRVTPWLHRSMIRYNQSSHAATRNRQRIEIPENGKRKTESTRSSSTDENLASQKPARPTSSI